MNLQQYANNVYSQSGEDGIIRKLLSLIAETHPLSNWCVEFGAWDGQFLSNTFNLVKNNSYKAVYIEPNKKYFMKLLRNMSLFDVICLNKYVGIDKNNSIDQILSSTPIPFDFDVLSIDIDGCDYHILQSINRYNPKIIIVEYNPSIPNNVYFVQQPDFSISHGASALAIHNLAISKNYTTVCATSTNLILLNQKYIQKDWNFTSDLSILRPDEDKKILVFFGYDGTVLFNKQYITYPWLGLRFIPSDFQVIPKYLRSYNRSFCQKIILIFYIIIFRSNSITKDHIKRGYLWLFQNK